MRLKCSSNSTSSSGDISRSRAAILSRKSWSSLAAERVSSMVFQNAFASMPASFWCANILLYGRMQASRAHDHGRHRSHESRIWTQRREAKHDQHRRTNLAPAWSASPAPQPRAIAGGADAELAAVLTPRSYEDVPPPHEPAREGAVPGIHRRP